MSSALYNTENEKKIELLAHEASVDVQKRLIIRANEYQRQLLSMSLGQFHVPVSIALAFRDQKEHLDVRHCASLFGVKQKGLSERISKVIALMGKSEKVGFKQLCVKFGCISILEEVSEFHGMVCEELFVKSRIPVPDELVLTTFGVFCKAVGIKVPNNVLSSLGHVSASYLKTGMANILKSPVVKRQYKLLESNKSKIKSKLSIEKKRKSATISNEDDDNVLDTQNSDGVMISNTENDNDNHRLNKMNSQTRSSVDRLNDGIYAILDESSMSKRRKILNEWRKEIISKLPPLSPESLSKSQKIQQKANLNPYLPLYLFPDRPSHAIDTRQL